VQQNHPAHVGIEFQIPLLQQFVVGRNTRLRRLFRGLSPYRHRKLKPEELLEITDQSLVFLVAYDLSSKGEVIGITRMVRKPLHGTPRCVQIHDTVVSPAHRRQHIGQSLTQKAIEQARHWHYQYVDVTVKPARTEAIALFTKLGFALVTAADPTVTGSEHLYRLMLTPEQH
jgi:ribosomal protein S18 acetylase RimI-like enzyme